MSATAFQRHRRALAAKLAEQEANTQGEQQEVTEGENESQEQPLSPDDVEDMEIERVKELLDHFEVKFAHNTGEDKLREKLKNAIG